MTDIDVPDRVVQAAAAADSFTHAFGGSPDGVWWAPGRVNLIGEHVDYHEGLCLPVALEVGTAVALRLRPDRVLRLGSAHRAASWTGDLDTIGVEPVPEWAAYVAGVAWALGEAGHTVTGFDAWVQGAVPLGAGLSSSAALECAVAVGLAQRLGLPGGAADDGPGRVALAKACIRAENEIAGASTGGMDQAVSLRASKGHALLLDCRDFAVRHLALDAPLAKADLEVVIVDTRANHTHSDGQYGRRRALSVSAAALLGVRVLRDVDPDQLPAALRSLPTDEQRAAVRHVVTEIGRVRQAVTALSGDRPGDLGPLMTASHVSLRDDYRVSSPELDAVVEQAQEAGALGARMTGGGFGGSAIALCSPDVTPAVLDGVARHFSELGWQPPRSLRLSTGATCAERMS